MTDKSTLKCWIVGGTNGSGKSSIYQNSSELIGSGEFVNADLVPRQISPHDTDNASLIAGRRVIERLQHLISHRENFVYETTLSSKQSIQLISTARNSGYRVGLLFVILSNVGLNVKRVHERVSRGGHSIRIAHETVVFENNGATPVKLVSLVDGNIVQNALDEAIISNCEIAEAVSDALGLSLDGVFKAAKPT
jgi:predicted ABC-type ATPase